MPVRIQDLDPTGAISEANALMEISDPTQSPSSRKATVAQVLAGAYAAADAAADYVADVALDLVAEATTRSNFDNQFTTAISTAHGCLAIAAAAGSTDIADNPNSEVRIARLGPKAWSLHALSQFGSGTSVASGSAMEWFFNIPEASTPGPFEDLYNALLGATYYPCGNRAWNNVGATFTWSVSVRAGLGGIGTTGLFFKVDGYNWTATSTAGEIISQLSLRMSGMVILP